MAPIVQVERGRQKAIREYVVDRNNIYVVQHLYVITVHYFISTLNKMVVCKLSKLYKYSNERGNFRAASRGAQNYLKRH